MKTIYYFFYEHGEFDFFFDKNMKVITWWHCNDANWRSEYMDELLAYFGGKVEDLPQALYTKAEVIAKNTIN